jgi:muramoyltetrapeptide carboxypeptidase
MSRKLSICVVAPSGIVTDNGGIERMKNFFRSRDIDVVVPEAVLSKCERFAGDDETRIAALHEAFARDDVDIVLAARGGYGLSRLLDKIDYDLLASSGKILVGHSDITALSLALLAKKSCVSFAGPHAIGDFGDPSLSELTIDNFFRVLYSAQTEIVVDADNPYEFETTGTLWGGNLSLVAALVGTPYLANITDGILFLEDINEAPYRVERMLYQLFHAGILQRQRAILLGDFRCDNPNSVNDYDLQNVVAHFRERLQIPILTGLPFGHIRDKLTLPIGATCRLSATRKQYKLTLSQYPYCWNRL